MAEINVFFWLLFIFQFFLWLILSLTKIGRVITLAWASLVTMGWLLNVYFNYFPFAQTGDVNLGVFAIKMTVLSWVELVVSLTVPPWVGLFAGTSLSAQQSFKFSQYR